MCLFAIADSRFIRHLAEGLQVPRDVEEVEGGWLVACEESHSVGFLPSRGGIKYLGRARGGSGRGHGQF